MADYPPSVAPLVYVAHALSPRGNETFASNREDASKWVAWLSKRYIMAPACAWIVLSSQWTEEEGRALGLSIDLHTIDHCDLMLLVGPRVSDGMNYEADHAGNRSVPVVNLVGHDYGSECDETLTGWLVRR